MEDIRLRPSICTEELREELLRLRLLMMAAGCIVGEICVECAKGDVSCSCPDSCGCFTG